MDASNNDPNDFGLVSRTLGGLPIVNAVLDRLGLPALLAGALPAADARIKLAPAVAIRLVVTNLVLGREPLYGLGEWAARYDPALLGLSVAEVGVLNDDRVGRALESLFDADRASLLTAVVLRAVSEFNIDTSQLHNDSTSVSVHGVYRDAVGAARGGKPTPAITRGHSKDHRPDLKQLVWILTVAADGAVPIAHRLADGNTVDDPPTCRPGTIWWTCWDVPTSSTSPTPSCACGKRWATSPPATAGSSPSCPAAAAKTASSAGGCRPTPQPGPRPPGAPARVWLNPTRCTRHPPRRHRRRRATASCGCTPPRRRPVTPPPRQTRIEAGVAAIEALDTKLAGPRCRLKTRVAVEQAATTALTNTRADRWVTFTVTETIDKTYKQERRGRPGPATRYREITTTRFGVRADIALDRIGYDAASDGCFPLITNDRSLTDAQVLAAYRYQPNLERRHHLLKSVQHAAPVLLHNPARIEALFCCQFLALLIGALIEREVRTGMRRAALDNIALYPEFRDCPAPSTERILEIFAPTTRHHLYQHGVLTKTFEPQLTAQQLQVLDLLGLAPTVYTQHHK